MKKRAPEQEPHSRKPKRRAPELEQDPGS